MRIPVVDTRGAALMPCTSAKARQLFKSGKAKPKRNKLGLFFSWLVAKEETKKRAKGSHSPSQAPKKGTPIDPGDQSQGSPEPAR